MHNFPADFFRYLIHVNQVDVDAVEKAMTGSKSKQKTIPSIKLKNRDLEELIILVEGYGNLKEKEIIKRLLDIVNESYKDYCRYL